MKVLNLITAAVCQPRAVTVQIILFVSVKKKRKSVKLTPNPKWTSILINHFHSIHFPRAKDDNVSDVLMGNDFIDLTTGYA